MAENELIQIDDIKSRIFTIRGMQVMLDSDLAEFYQTETKYINRAVKRNPDRFPEGFIFQLTKTEMESLRFQFGTLKTGRGQHRKFNPHVFTEAGVAMLSAVLQTEISIRVSVQIIQAFVKMRHFILENASIFQRLSTVEVKQIEADKKFEMLFKALENNELPSKQGVLFDGQVFDAHKFVSDIIRSAEKSIILIDNYVDDTVLTLFSKRKQGVKLKIFTKNLSKQLVLDTQKFNEQFPPAEIIEFNHSHDRFMIIDDKDLYHFGASLKDLGKKWFGFSKMDIEVTKMLTRI
ncbi:MAG TPA: ORF6N domain-containing protein [bacterium]|nr:ORF6N domain-containing protein [bacterium]